MGGAQGRGGRQGLGPHPFAGRAGAGAAQQGLSAPAGAAMQNGTPRGVPFFSCRRGEAASLRGLAVRLTCAGPPSFPASGRRAECLVRVLPSCCSQPTGWQTERTRSNLSSRRAPFHSVEGLTQILPSLSARLISGMCQFVNRAIGATVAGGAARLDRFSRAAPAARGRAAGWRRESAPARPRGKVAPAGSPARRGSPRRAPSPVAAGFPRPWRRPPRRRGAP
ncbi:hypothetical protein D9M72_485480 [compost metagenome]